MHRGTSQRLSDWYLLPQGAYLDMLMPLFCPVSHQPVGGGGGGVGMISWGSALPTGWVGLPWSLACSLGPHRRGPAWPSCSCRCGRATQALPPAVRCPSDNKHGGAWQVRVGYAYTPDAAPSTLASLLETRSAAGPRLRASCPSCREICL